MALALILVAGAAALARLAGGSWSTLAGVQLRGKRLVVVAVAAQLIGAGLTRLTDGEAWYPAGLVLSALAAGAFCLRNVRVAGLGLVTLGLAGNAIVVAANASMPVSLAAASRARVSVTAIASGDDPRHSIAGPASSLRFLGDDIPLPLPGRPEVVSPGDALIAAGLGEFVFLGMLPGGRRLQRRTQPADRALDAGLQLDAG